MQTAEDGNEPSDEPDVNDAQRRVFVYKPMIPGHTLQLVAPGIPFLETFKVGFLVQGGVLFYILQVI